MRMQDLRSRGGYRAAGTFRPVSAATSGRPATTAYSTSYLQTPTKEQLREELAQAARNTASKEAK